MPTIPAFRRLRWEDHVSSSPAWPQKLSRMEVLQDRMLTVSLGEDHREGSKSKGERMKTWWEAMVFSEHRKVLQLEGRRPVKS